MPDKFIEVDGFLSRKNLVVEHGKKKIKGKYNIIDFPK